MPMQSHNFCNFRKSVGVLISKLFSPITSPFCRNLRDITSSVMELMTDMFQLFALRDGGKTMTFKGESWRYGVADVNNEMGQKHYLSASDIQALNKIYCS